MESLELHNSYFVACTCHKDVFKEQCKCSIKPTQLFFFPFFFFWWDATKKYPRAWRVGVGGGGNQTHTIAAT